MSELLKGVPVGKAIAEELKPRIEALLKRNIIPTISIIRLGESPDDIVYERSVIKKFQKNNLKTNLVTLPLETKEEELINEIEKINSDPLINGVLLMRPLPRHINEKRVCNKLCREKDVDGITPGSMAGLYAGEKNVFGPCTAEACMELLKFYNIDVKSKNAVVMGRSLVIGKPVSMMLLKENATVTVCHSKTKNIEKICKNADVLVCAVGMAKIVDDRYVKHGQIVVDVGINTDDEGNLCGDADFEKIENIAGSISPVPGGVGAVTTSILMRHVVVSCERMNP